MCRQRSAEIWLLSKNLLSTLLTFSSSLLSACVCLQPKTLQILCNLNTTSPFCSKQYSRPCHSSVSCSRSISSGHICVDIICLFCCIHFTVTSVQQRRIKGKKKFQMPTQHSAKYWFTVTCVTYSTRTNRALHFISVRSSETGNTLCGVGDYLRNEPRCWS